MAKTLLDKGTLVAGAAVSLLALISLVILILAPSPRDASGRQLLLLGIVGAAVGFLLVWSTIIGYLSRTRIWSPQWTFLAGALPFYALGMWTFFVGPLQMRFLGYMRMLLMVCFGSASGLRARKKAYPQFSDKDSPSADLPPPTLFPK